MTSRLLLAASLLLAGCAAQAPAAGDPITARYGCSNGEQVTVRYLPLQEAAVLTRGGQAVELRQQPAASGFWYTNGPVSVRGKGDEIRLEIGRMAPIACQVVSSQQAR